MYRALYAHKSKLPKYLSFESGDKFTLVDTSVSDQWFLAQNGLGEIGYVPFNYIKKVEATTEQQVKFIDGAMEAIHLQATSEGGQYTKEQRLIMKKLVKHRAEVIKTAKDVRSSTRRRPAPAPPGVPETGAEGSPGAEVKNKGHGKADEKEQRLREGKESPATTNSSHGVGKTKNCDARRGSVQSEINVTEKAAEEDKVRKSKSVTSSIGQAPSLVSSYSSNASEMTTTSDSVHDSSKAKNGSNPFEDDCSDTEEVSDNKEENLQTPVSKQQNPETGVTSCNSFKSPETEEIAYDSSKNPFADEDDEEEDLSNTPSASELGSESPALSPAKHCNAEKSQADDSSEPQLTVSIADESFSSVVSSSLSSPIEDLPPPPPPEVYDDISADQFGASDDLLPAPPDLCPTEDGLRVDDMYVNLNSDILELCGQQSAAQCNCDNYRPKFDVKGKFFASNALELPTQRRVNITTKDQYENKEANRVFNSLLKCQGGDKDSKTAPPPARLLELAQAHCVQVTHADCEEMIGEFRKVSNLSHEDSHWAFLTAMNLLAAKVPHIKPSLEAVGLRFNMGYECNTTGKDYQCEDAQLLDSLTSELSSVTNDAQQRGHYLRDDLDSIIDIITGLTETLNNAKRCVSIAAIQKDNYNLVELIAKYYQMETRWVIHLCMLQLIQAICRINPYAIQEFLYSELPQEMVTEMQQHHNDDNRLMQVAKTLGVVFMKGQASPHKLSLTMDLHFFIWLLGVTENLSELNRPGDVDILLALVCAYHLQHQDSPCNPLMDAFKMAQGHALLTAALCFLSKHDDPTTLLECVVEPKVNSVILLLTNLFDSPDTSDLLYMNDAEALVGIFEEFLRDLSREDPLRMQLLHLLENFMRNYPDTVTLRQSLSSRLGPLLLNIQQERGPAAEIAAHILEDNTVVFDDI
ncbi:Nck-interacting protein with SH3 domain [Elysia marginata]|uniref:Nck-interacting protein with SH3 domain n=1 Tax=Elysia marginata TaxID=1093978 RepID=A0AAV4GCP0_9GAST|nr:Nck-interacting protein with SH3 domain [Elysia marginata]